MRISAIHCFQIQHMPAESPEQLETQLQQRTAYDCPGHEMESLGWASPFGEDSEVLCHAVNGCWLMCAQHEKRLLPSAVVQDQLHQRIELMKQQGESISRQEKQQLKEDIEATLMPKAFIKRTRTFLYLDASRQRLIVCASGRSQVERITTLLRHTVGHLVLKPLSTPEHTLHAMTQWLSTHSLPEHFELGNECRMVQSSKSQGRIQFTQHTLDQASILQHLQEGNVVTQLALSLKDMISFKLNQDFSFTGIKWPEQITEQPQTESFEHPAQQLDSTFVILSGILNQVIEALESHLTPHSTPIHAATEEVMT